MTRLVYINCGSKYFETKYGTPKPMIALEGPSDYHNGGPGGLLYIGRVLAEGNPELFHGTIYYGHVAGLGEFIHESEIGEEVII